jgi:hypothetical protein
MLVRMREAEIQRSIIDNLRWRGILAFRCQPAPVPVRKGNSIVGFRRADAFNVGMPDIVCVIRGRFVGIEVKSESGRQRPEQRTWGKHALGVKTRRRKLASDQFIITRRKGKSL